VSGKDLIHYGDAAMFEATPMKKDDDKSRVTPQVFLLSATTDPLGVVASAFRMYAGKPTYDLSHITDEERVEYWEESLRTHLKAAWEFIDLHFFVEGVTRSFTHQMVRQRTAVYAQESLRFAVKRGIAQEAAIPPAIASDADALVKFLEGLEQAEQAYETLIGMGVPAEDARGLLPHCVTTRLNYKTNFRNLVTEMGKRLCTQAQFEWRSVAIGIVKAIRSHVSTYWHPNHDLGIHPRDGAWQWARVSQPLPQTFTPVCYQAGKCVFMGKLDRGCSIRHRVNSLAAMGVPPDKWDGHDWEDGTFCMPDGEMLDGIQPQEWLANPWAGITTTDEDRPA
jgi:flavin-dependent thymidylate synthase